MDEDMINIRTPVTFDNSISHYEFYSHHPYATTALDHSDEVRITVQNQDLYILPHKSYVHLTGKLLKPDNTVVTKTKLINNAICHLFEEVRYEINAYEIDKVKNLGITTTMKNLLSVRPSQSELLENAGWLGVTEQKTLTDSKGRFDICVPLSMLLGFAEDYRKLTVNVKHELILIRSRSDTNAIIQTEAENFKITLTKIEWMVPYVTLSDTKKIELLNFIQRDPAIVMSFRSWELYEYPMLPQTTHHVWTVKTATQLEKPRYVIVGFQTARKNKAGKNAGNFDHCNIANIKLFLNSQCYPYGNLNVDVSEDQYAILYDMYANFQTSYYEQAASPAMSKRDFLTHASLIVIDCSKQNEALKFGPVDVRLEFEARASFPPDTAAYCLILHDRIIQYHPISGEVKKMV